MPIAIEPAVSWTGELPANFAFSHHSALVLRPKNGLLGRVIDSDKALSELAEDIGRSEWVAIDTEADSLYAYPEKLCLVQCSLAERDEIIDPLAGVDLGILVSALVGRECILHGADYDLRLLQRTVGMLPDRIFDTMVAARLVGLQELSLERLTLKLLGHALTKGPQRANWARRPLTPAMTAYALNDTRYLRPIAELLKVKLTEQGRLGWHEETCRRLIHECAQPPVIDEDRVWRLKGAAKLNPLGLTVLREAWRWREEEALRAGLPPYFILAHENLVKIADAAAAQERFTAHLPKRFSDRRRSGLDSAISRALSLPAQDQPKPIGRARGKPLSRRQKQEYLELQTKRDKHATELGIDPSLIASRATLVALAVDGEKAHASLMDWQRGLLNGETA